MGTESRNIALLSFSLVKSRSVPAMASPMSFQKALMLSFKSLFSL
jgi:hypothetical protein